MVGLLFAAAAMGAASGLGYGSMAPRSQLYGRTFTGGARGSRQIALTFDDGPNEAHTLDLLEVLDRHAVKATFFMVGRYVTLQPKIAQAVARAGHTIGNHTFSHPNLIFCSRPQVKTQLQECERVLADTIGEHSILFRPPFGGRRPAVLRQARELGFVPVMWSVTGFDWKPGPAAQIEANLARQIRGGDVVLLHDGSHLAPNADRASTVAATDSIIRRYREQGYQFVTVPEMMRTAPPTNHRRERIWPERR